MGVAAAAPGVRAAAPQLWATLKIVGQKLGITGAAELLFEFQNGERCGIENDVVCDGGVVDVE